MDKKIPWTLGLNYQRPGEDFAESIMLAVDTAFKSSNQRAEVVLYDSKTDKPDLIFRIEVIDLQKVDGKDINQEGWTQFDLTGKPEVH